MPHPQMGVGRLGPFLRAETGNSHYAIPCVFCQALFAKKINKKISQILCNFPTCIPRSTCYNSKCQGERAAGARQMIQPQKSLKKNKKPLDKQKNI